MLRRTRSMRSERDTGESSIGDTRIYERTSLSDYPLLDSLPTMYVLLGKSGAILFSCVEQISQS